MAKKKRKTTGKSSLTLSLSSQARDRLAEMAQKAGYSRSAFVESVMSGKVSIGAITPEKNLAFTMEDETAQPPKMAIAVVEDAVETETAASPEIDNSHLEEIEKLQAKIAEQAKQITNLSTAKPEKKSALKAPPSRPQDNAKSVKKVSADLAKKDKEIAALNKQLETSQSDQQKLEKELASVKNSLASKTAENEVLQAAAKTSKQAQDKQSSAKLELLQSEKEQLEKQVTDLQKQVSTMDDASAALQQLQSDKEKLETQ